MVTKNELRELSKDIIRQGSVTVGTTSSNISPYLESTLRKVLVITNTSTNGANITLSWGSPAIAGYGIVLNPSGSWSESIDSAYVPSIQDIWAISSVANGTLAIQERIIQL